MGAISDALKADLATDEEFAEGYADSFLDTYVATQIKVLREQRELTQKQLADALDTAQTVISRIENVNYSAWNIGTLKKLARAYKVRLHVSFETYGSLIGDVERFNRERLQRAPRHKDPVLFPELLPKPAAQLKVEQFSITEDDPILRADSTDDTGGNVVSIDAWKAQHEPPLQVDETDSPAIMQEAHG